MGIRVGNIKLGDRDGIYIGREMSGRRGSVLGNNFFIGKDGDRSEVIEKYRIWLWGKIKEGDKEVMGELNRIKGLVEDGEDVVLNCWCKPKACHGDVIVKCIEWMIGK